MGNSKAKKQKAGSRSQLRSASQQHQRCRRKPSKTQQQLELSKRSHGVRPRSANQAAIATQIPFAPHDRILLVGEGDFSFAQSIVAYHGCAAVLATCFDDQDKLLQKYPQAQEHISYLLAHAQSVLFSIDASKLNNSRREIHRGLHWDRIIFNFPHVGGKSTDINRQVRYNQELLVSFFRSALPLLSPAGSIIVTLFEGEPYSLWNIKDLARHVGLRVGPNFKFLCERYPGYKHALTKGYIQSRDNRKTEKSARTYIFYNVASDQPKVSLDSNAAICDKGLAEKGKT